MDPAPVQCMARPAGSPGSEAQGGTQFDAVVRVLLALLSAGQIQAQLDVPVESTGEGVGKTDAAAGCAVVAVVIAQVRGEDAPLLTHGEAVADLAADLHRQAVAIALG